jgi:DNA-cytosine methyltransferase
LSKRFQTFTVQGQDQNYGLKPSLVAGCLQAANQDNPRSAGTTLVMELGGQGMPECIGFSEIDRHAEAVYRFHHPEHVNFGDATKIVPESLPDFEFLIAGFPCQAFSIAGKRQGFDDARGTLFFEIARVLSHKRPRHFVLENVGGLRSHDAGKTLQRILGVLSDIGYCVEMPLLNSKDFGVPQNRERCYFVGHLGGECEREILSVRNGNEEIAATNRRVGRDIAMSLDANYHKGAGFKDLEKGLWQMIDHSAGIGVHRSEIKVHSLFPRTGDPEKGGTGHLTKTDGITYCLDAANTLAIEENLRIRRLTPIECERLQGLPDGYTKFGRYGDEVKQVSDTQRYRGLGNSFTVNVIEAIIERMIDVGCLAHNAHPRRGVMA